MKFTATDRRALGGSVSMLAMLLATAMPAAAQDLPTATQNAENKSAEPTTQVQTPTDDAGQASDGEEIVVTGSLLRQTDAATPSPVTTITAANLDARGINTVQGAIQSLASNNGPALTNSFTANGAFAGGASAVSLRGLSTNSTLVLFDGLRAAYYPLADDATRNFVDLNTIPDDIVDRIEVLRDGASSSYGADAIAGVVNIITKRSFNGISGRAEAGISQDGVAANQRLTLTAGTGDLDEKGYNAYVSGFYFRSEAVYNRDLPYPFNSDDQRGVGTGGPNNVRSTAWARRRCCRQQRRRSPAANFYVRPANGATAVGRVALPAADRRAASTALPTRPPPRDRAPPNNARHCQRRLPAGLYNQYGVVSPNIERFGGSARFTAQIRRYQRGVSAKSTSSSRRRTTPGDPSVIRGNAPAGILFPQYSTSSAAAQYAPGSTPLSLPVYVCARGTVTCTAANGRLNPNNSVRRAGPNRAAARHASRHGDAQQHPQPRVSRRSGGRQRHDRRRLELPCRCDRDAH